MELDQLGPPNLGPREFPHSPRWQTCANTSPGSRRGFLLSGVAVVLAPKDVLAEISFCLSNRPAATFRWSRWFQHYPVDSSWVHFRHLWPADQVEAWESASGGGVLPKNLTVALFLQPRSELDRAN